MVAHGTIPHDAQMCVSGCGGVETAQHLFLSCTIFASFWSLVRECIGVFTADLYHIHDHFV